LHKRQAPIKAVLLDQAFIAGIGNMYADEALFAARIHPLRKANSLSPQKIRNLHKAIVDVLQAAVDSKGASIDTYKRPDGQLGTAHFNFSVAHRGGKPCPVCGTAIQRLAIRNRGSYFCPNCQKP
jgi:formamidopyrimidine-DNA glycosylase